MGLIILEIALRTGGFVLSLAQERNNLNSLGQKRAYRIICLGESTTANEYPHFLEEALNRHSKQAKFSVMDLGVPGNTTDGMLADLEHNLSKYEPDIVVAMLGVNEEFDNVGGRHNVTGSDFSRVIKLLKQLKQRWRTKFLEITARPAQKDNSLPMQIVSQDEQKATVKADLESCATVYSLACNYWREKSYDKAEELFSNTIKMGTTYYQAYVDLAMCYLRKGRYDLAEETLKKVIVLNPKIAKAYGGLAHCFREQGKNEAAEKYFEKANIIRLKYYNPKTKQNYKKIRTILSQKGIVLVCVQYLVRSIKTLEHILQPTGELILVDNETSFKQAIEQASYGEYFVDMFGGDFGHCTDKGNILLAENIAREILQQCFNPRLEPGESPLQNKKSPNRPQ